ncbi:hypothetical protein MRS44_013061 [Fusarium solani]|uniref:uncharacterized protein n=1 Tax=Fusarium solani TaxID=169388 RepID=UPI0032C4329F|nr:hypothetical protein MRS44_013061 [Fusarium solani]
MQIKALLFAPLVATGLVSAVPSSKATNFELLALRSASDIHFSPVQAALNHLFLHLPHQKATCDAKPDNHATFSLVDGELYLYRKSGMRQKLYVDRSGMGQGILGYTTGNEPGPRNGERKGWKINKYGDLTFDGAGFIACTDSTKGSWSVGISIGLSNPGGNEHCLGFTARTITTRKPNSCKYTTQ